MKKLSIILLLCLFSGPAVGQNLDSADILKPLSDSWLTYSGDYTSKRYSALKQIDQLNVKNLTLAWTTRVTAGLGQGGGGGFGRFGGPSFPTIVGGEGTQDAGPGTNIRASILQVDGVLYFSTPDNAWAADARDGTVLWHYVWKTKGGTHIGNRGLAMWKNWLYMETPDDYLICLDAKTGKAVWDVNTVDKTQPYTITGAPRVVKGHVLIGNGGAEYGVRGYFSAYDAETGKQAWRFYTVPGDPSKPFESPALEKAAKTWTGQWWKMGGGGTVWDSLAYDPELDLLYVGTGNGSRPVTRAVE